MGLRSERREANTGDKQCYSLKASVLPNSDTKSQRTAVTHREENIGLEEGLKVYRLPGTDGIVSGQ